jgi:hypothetical protein
MKEFCHNGVVAVLQQAMRRLARRTLRRRAVDMNISYQD